jgi:hypothetical protein
MRVTRDALAVDTPIWMVGDSAYDTVNWNVRYGQQVVVSVDPYKPRNTDSPKDIEFRVEDRIKEHSEDVN